ncbi:hypothetical protein GQ53DRAFT_756489 [Thozetella sp. PMI_491]|nr:hypothetical protein GQ53DRAFT_756489 [Thozetella sp. PMI_491]
MDPTLLLSRPSASYGQACVGCYKAKCRCVRRLDSAEAKCDRCHRLAISCQPSQALRRRGGGRPPNRTAQLEEKLDDLVTLLRSQAQPSTVLNIASAEPTTPPAEIRTAVATQAPLVYPQQQRQRTRSPPSSLVSDLVYATALASSSNHEFGELHPIEAEEYLQFFKDVYLPAFPLLFLPPETSAAQLRTEKPWLWLAIQSVCCKSASRKSVLEDELCNNFAQRVLVQSERSLDLLLAHMVQTACGILYSSKQALNMSSTMAAVLVQDLSLDRNPGFERSGVRAYVYGVKPPIGPRNFGNRQQSSREERTNEERRAVLACYCLCSGNSQKLGTPPMRWTPHMDDYLRHLASEAQCGNDEILVIITKCSRILDDILAVSSSIFSEGDYAGQPQRETLPPSIPIKALRSMLQEVRQQIRPALLESRVVKFWLYFTEVMIYDLALRPSPETSVSTSPNQPVNLTRAQHLYSCLRATKLFLKNFFSFKPQEHYGLHLHYWLHFLRCIRMVYRLLLIDDPGWDRATVRDSVDLMETIQRGIDTCASVPAAVGLKTNGSDLFSSLAATLRHAKAVWTEALELAGAIAPAAVPAAPVLNNASQPTPPQSVLPDDLVLLDFYDDSWMGNVFSWNEQP